MNLKTYNKLDVHNKKVLLRVDYNVPMNEQCVIQDETRIEKSIETIDDLIKRGAIIIILSHAGRPKGKVVEELRLKPMAECLSRIIKKTVTAFSEVFSEEINAALAKAKPGDVFMLENLRFYPGEKANDPEFAKKLAAMGDIYINDAFAAVHREHASVVAITKYLPSHAGKLIQCEVKSLSYVVDNPRNPCTLLIGGAKVDTKIPVLKHYYEKAQYVLIGGALANTFLAAQGYNVGASFFQDDKLDIAREILKESKEHGQEIVLPVDVVVAKEASNKADTKVVLIDEVEDDMLMFDIGPQTIDLFNSYIKKSETIIWNGPMGLYEFTPFRKGSQKIAEAVSKSSAHTVIGGGDTVDSVKQSGIDVCTFSHVSTGGGAMLEFLEGKSLPGLEVLCG